MIQSNLVLHRGAREVTLDELDAVPLPPSTSTYFPVAHGTVLNRVTDTLTAAGFGIDSMQLSLARDNARFFGTLTLTNKLGNDACLAVGVRNSTDKSLPLGLVCGTRVFVCDNLAFSSEIVIARRHSRHGADRFREALANAIVGLRQYQASAQQRIAQLQSWELSLHEADSLLLKSCETGTVSWRMLPAVIAAWRNPEHVEFQPRTGWSLLNAYTGVLKDRQKSSPQEAAMQTIRLQRLLTPPDVIDVESTAVAS